MPKRLLGTLLLLTAEIAELYVAGLLADATALYLARRNGSKVESWLRRQNLRSMTQSQSSRTGAFQSAPITNPRPKR